MSTHDTKNSANVGGTCGTALMTGSQKSISIVAYSVPGIKMDSALKALGQVYRYILSDEWGSNESA